MGTKVNTQVFAHQMDVADDKLLILPYIPTNRMIRVLDFGAGSGVNAINIVKHNPYAIVYALEQDKNMYDILVENTKEYPQIIPIFGNLENFTEKDLDIILCSAVLHEQKAPRAVTLQELYHDFYRLLVENGQLIIREAVADPSLAEKEIYLIFKNKFFFEKVDQYIINHQLENYWTDPAGLLVNKDKQTIVGKYYDVYATGFALVYSVEDFELREQYEFRFLWDEELPQDPLFRLEYKYDYVKNDIVKYWDEKYEYSVPLAPTNGLRIYKKN